MNAQFVSLEELYAQSDVISLHMNLNPSSYQLLDKNAFKQMKKNVIIVNTARGDVINQDDLVWAIEKDLIWGAGLDVTNPEPLPSDHKLLSFPQVCILPHIGSATVETRTAMSDLVLKNIMAFIKRMELSTKIV